MDPYLEDPAFWSDFHHRFIDDLSDAIAARLPESYFTKIDEHVIIVDPDLTDPQLIKPDVSVAHDSRLAGGGAATLAELDLQPEIMINVVQLDPTTQGYIEIRRMPERNLVAVVELLSPVNKNGGRGQYLEKRQLLLRQKVNLVEIDLLRGGRRISFSKPLPDADYFGFVSRSEPKSICEAYHWSVRRRLPRLPVPLRPEDGDIAVDLQEVFKVTFDRGRYGRQIDYNKAPPAPAFPKDDSKWVVETAGRK
jgi:hypothetical protein